MRTKNQREGGEALKAYRVVTTRKPFFDGVRQPQNATIHGMPDDRAIMAMLERTWIVDISLGDEAT